MTTDNDLDGKFKDLKAAWVAWESEWVSGWAEEFSENAALGVRVKGKAAWDAAWAEIVKSEEDSKISELEAGYKAASAKGRAAISEYRMAKMLEVELRYKSYSAAKKSEEAWAEYEKAKETKNDGR